jgi:hypothetical protein
MGVPSFAVDSSTDPISVAKRDVEQAVAAYGWGSRELDAAQRVLREAQRDEARSNGMPFATVVDLGVMWTAGAPMPILVSGERTAVFFYLAHPSNDVGIVEFFRVSAVKMGAPNDEVFHGHPLSERGLEYYKAHVIENSAWITEIMAINSVHLRYNPDNWKSSKHYLFAFHDDTFECIASDVKVSVESGYVADVASAVSNCSTVKVQQWRNGACIAVIWTSSALWHLLPVDFSIFAIVGLHQRSERWH